MKYSQSRRTWIVEAFFQRYCVVLSAARRWELSFGSPRKNNEVQWGLNTWTKLIAYNQNNCKYFAYRIWQIWPICHNNSSRGQQDLLLGTGYLVESIRTGRPTELLFFSIFGFLFAFESMGLDFFICWIMLFCILLGRSINSHHIHRLSLWWLRHRG